MFWQCPGATSGQHVEQDFSHRCIEFDLVLVFGEVDVLQSCVNFRSAILGHGFVLPVGRNRVMEFVIGELLTES